MKTLIIQEIILYFTTLTRYFFIFLITHPLDKSLKMLTMREREAVYYARWKPKGLLSHEKEELKARLLIGHILKSQDEYAWSVVGDFFFMKQFESGKNQNHDWLNDSIPLDIFQSSSLRLRHLVNRLFDKITPLIKVSSTARQKEALKIILINLYQANQLNKPVRYSRDKNYYTCDRRYGQLFFKYDRIIPIIDGLERLGYIEQSTFYFDHKKEEGKQTRMWGTETLWSLFREHRIPEFALFIPEQAHRDEIIILRNESKKDIGYRETSQIRRMREDLERYNAFVKRHTISLQLKDSTIVDNRFLVEDIYKNIHKGKVWIKSVGPSLTTIWEGEKIYPYYHSLNII